MIMSAIVGRKKEIEELEHLFDSDRPEFVAVYGRRRVGKTFLIKQALKDRFTFQHTGVSPVDQLKNPLFYPLYTENATDFGDVLQHRGRLPFPVSITPHLFVF